MQYYLSKHNKVWQNIKTKNIVGNKLELKDGEKLTDYEQIPLSKEETKEQVGIETEQTKKQKQTQKTNYSFSPTEINEEKGVF